MRTSIDMVGVFFIYIKGVVDMSKRKATKAELEYGIGEVEVNDEGIEPEIDDNDNQVVALACDAENDIDDDELIKKFHEESVPGNDVWEDDE